MWLVFLFSYKVPCKFIAFGLKESVLFPSEGFRNLNVERPDQRGGTLNFVFRVAFTSFYFYNNYK